MERHVRDRAAHASVVITSTLIYILVRHRSHVIPVNYLDDILPEYRDTPVGLLLEYHNLRRAIGSVTAPQVLIGMCMDSRKSLRIPNDFAFVLRTAGANMRDNEFRISYAIAVGGVRTIVLIAHTDCGMARLDQRRDQFIRGLTEAAGWDEARAVRHFEESAPKFGMRDEVQFVLQEAERLRGILSAYHRRATTLSCGRRPPLPVAVRRRYVEE